MEEIASICYKKFSSYYPPHLVEWYIQTSYDNYAWSFEFKLYKNTEKQRVIIVYSESLDLAYVSNTGATIKWRPYYTRSRSYKSIPELVIPEAPPLPPTPLEQCMKVDPEWDVGLTLYD